MQISDKVPALCEHFKISETPPTPSHMPFQQSRRQAVLNFLSYYDGEPDDQRIELLLNLGILDRYGMRACIWYDFGKEWQMYRPHRCALPLPEPNNRNIYDAFRRLFFYVSDPVIKDDDVILREEMVSFAEHALCSAHRGRANALIPDLISKVTEWRKDYIFGITDGSNSPAETPDTSSAKSRISRIFAFPRRSISGRSRATSRDSSDEEAASKLQKPYMPKRRIRQGSLGTGLGITQDTLPQSVYKDPELRARDLARKQRQVGSTKGMKYTDSGKLSTAK